MSLRDALLAEWPAANVLTGPQELHAELLDRESGSVWQTQGPISRDDYAALELSDRWLRVGIGTGVMDAHYFRRSPGAPADAAVTEQEIAGHVFIHCANPPAGGPEKPIAGGPLLLRVDKHHSLVFEAGREVSVLRLPDGRDFVQVIAASPDGGGVLQASKPAAELPLPGGWSLRRETLVARTTIDLPNPTEAWFFADGASYQGPVSSFAQPGG